MEELIREAQEIHSIRGKDLLLRIVNVYAFGSETGKKILSAVSKELSGMTWGQVEARLEEAELAP